MPAPLIIRIDYTVPPDVSKRAHREVMRKANEAQGEYWHMYLLPKALTPQAKGTHGHKPRTRATIRRKLAAAKHGKAELGGLVDNVWSGFMTRALRSHHSTRAFPTRVTVRMIGPRYCTMRPYKSNQPDKAAELLTVLPDDRRAMLKVADDEYCRGIMAYRAPKTVTIQ